MKKLEIEKSEMYVSWLHGLHLSRKENYYQSKKVYQINITKHCSYVKNWLEEYEYINPKSQKEIPYKSPIKIYIVSLDILKKLNYNVGISNTLKGYYKLLNAQNKDEIEQIGKESEELMNYGWWKSFSKI